MGRPNAIGKVKTTDGENPYNVQPDEDKKVNDIINKIQPPKMQLYLRGHDEMKDKLQGKKLTDKSEFVRPSIVS